MAVKVPSAIPSWSSQSTIQRMVLGCGWQPCWVLVLLDGLRQRPKADQDLMAVAMQAVFVIQAPERVRSVWQRVTERQRKRRPNAVPSIE